MKKVLIIVSAIVVGLYTHAQTFNNTIVNDNSSWATLFYGLGTNDIPCCVSTQYVYFDGDSIVEDYSYKKTFSFDDKLHENIKYEGLIREQNQKTYFIPANSETEYLLYDFSLEEGMSFEVEYIGVVVHDPVTLYVSSVDFVEINGFAKKRIQISTSPYAEWGIIDTWIEEIGSLSGILNPCYRFGWGGGVKELLCYYQNDELIYKNPVYSECYYDNPDDIISVKTTQIDDYSIYPNPVDDLLTICAANNMITHIEIYDIYGRIICSQIYSETIKVNSLSKGLYLLKVYDTNKQLSVFKIIKN